jgi:hypothetical protein
MSSLKSGASAGWEELAEAGATVAGTRPAPPSQ